MMSFVSFSFSWKENGKLGANFLPAPVITLGVVFMVNL